MRNDVMTLAAVETIREDVADMAAEGWDVVDGRFDWEAFLNRLENRLDVDLPGDMLHPVIRKVQRIARDAYAETL